MVKRSETLDYSRLSNSYTSVVQASKQGRRLIVLCFVLSNMCFSLLSYSGGPGARGGWRASVAAPWPSSPSRALSCRPVHSAEDFVALAARSLRLRAELATLVHARSSRSHLIITATLTRGPAAGGSPGKWPRRGRGWELQTRLWGIRSRAVVGGDF